MPFYTCFAVTNSLSAAQKAFIAEEITRIHEAIEMSMSAFRCKADIRSSSLDVCF